MPTYEYQCKKCNHRFESFQWVDSRLQPTKEPCPECGEISVKQGFFTAPSMKMDENMRIDKPHNANGFQDVIEKVANGAGVKGTQYEKQLRDKHMF